MSRSLQESRQRMRLGPGKRKWRLRRGRDLRDLEVELIGLSLLAD